MKTIRLLASCAVALITFNVATAAPPTNEARPYDDKLTIEMLDEDSDYSVFLSPKVSEELRRGALRKLFHLPRFNTQDGLGDYDDDYRSFEPLGDILTAEMHSHMERQAMNAREWSGQVPPASVVLAK